MNISYETQATATNPMTTAQRDQLLAEWAESKKNLEAAKEKEAELRKQIVADPILFDPDKDTGTETYNLGNGYQLKAVKKINYKVDNKDGKAFAMLQQLASLGEVSEFKSKELFRFDANLSLSTYKKLDDEEKALVDAIITTKPAMPSLTLVEPKKK